LAVIGHIFERVLDKPVVTMDSL